MRLSFKVTASYLTLTLLTVTVVVCGIGWYAAQCENQRLAERQRSLTSELSTVNESLIAARQDLEASREATEKVVDDLERRIAELTDTRDQLMARLDVATNDPLVVPNGEIRWIDP